MRGGLLRAATPVFMFVPAVVIVVIYMPGMPVIEHHAMRQPVHGVVRRCQQQGKKKRQQQATPPGGGFGVCR